jgi:hypothetical protein
LLDLKRRINLLNIAATTTSLDKSSHEFVIHVPTEYDYRYTSPKREEILEILRGFYLKQHEAPMPRYGVPPAALKAYATTEKQAKKNIYLLPDEAFRLPDTEPKDGVKEEDTKSSPTSSSTVVDTKDGETLFQSVKEEKPVTLSDFKVIKKIGKGTFGTVSLHYNC